MHSVSVNCRFATTVHLILPVNDVSTPTAVTAQAFSAQHFKGCEQEVSGSRHIWKCHTCPVCQAEESTSAGTAPAKHVCPCTPPFAISRFVAPDGSPARQSKIQILKIPVLIFMAVDTMKLNRSQHNRASEAGWSFLWVSSLWCANLEEIHSGYDFYPLLFIKENI